MLLNVSGELLLAGVAVVEAEERCVVRVAVVSEVEVPQEVAVDFAVPREEVLGEVVALEVGAGSKKWICHPCSNFCFSSVQPLKTKVLLSKKNSSY